MWFYAMFTGALLINFAGFPPKIQLSGIMVSSGTMESSKIIVLSPTTTLSSKIQFLPIRAQFPIILALITLLGPMIVYFPIVIAINLNFFVIGGFKIT